MDAPWDEFHRVVNMTSQELSAWLRTSSAGEEAEELPEESGTRQGRRALAVLRKRRVDLTDDDIALCPNWWTRYGPNSRPDRPRRPPSRSGGTT